MTLSIIIPVYNKIHYLAGLLEQVMLQTFSDFECLLIDDGSTDGSGAVCDVFAARDSRFKVFHIHNSGVSHARNVGLDAALGKYITFIDSDDSIRPRYLENLIYLIQESGVDLVISGYEKVDAAGNRLCTVTPKDTGVVSMSSLLPDFARIQLQTGLYGCCVAKIFPRVLIQNIRFDESLHLAEDFDFYLNIYALVEAVCLDDRTDYLYLQEAENSTAKTDSEKIDYLSQLRINLHWRSVLQDRGVYNCDNKQLVEKRLDDYAYFVLFHTPIPHYRECFNALYKYCKIDQISLNGGNILRNWLFFCLRHNLYHTCRGTMYLYRAARRIWNGVS